ncbi:MAG: (2Fe-2S)-binding protein [Proteobacteria bacterium]|nr:(2Fe-2S)-binding protein [Pseudomonadota bacterium]
MIVCQCRGVTDRQIRRLVRGGACSTREVVRATGAGTNCGDCRSSVRKAVVQAVEASEQRSFLLTQTTTTATNAATLKARKLLGLPVPVEG